MVIFRRSFAASYVSDDGLWRPTVALSSASVLAAATLPPPRSPLLPAQRRRRPRRGRCRVPARSPRGSFALLRRWDLVAYGYASISSSGVQITGARSPGTAAGSFDLATNRG